jgi:benzaldehyde dehydrogenase (NAD)
MAAFDEERFGPVAVITTFRNDEEALALANATDYGLVAAVVSADLARAQRVADGYTPALVWLQSVRPPLSPVPCRLAAPHLAPS